MAFVHDAGGGPPRFLEVYPRLPPEHGLVEETTGIDLVRPPTARRCTAAGSTASRRHRAATPCRPGSTPRTPSAGSPRRRAWWPGCGSGRAPASGSTPPSPRATSSPPTTRCSWPRCWRGARPVRQARVRLRRALDETTVVIDGGSTNKGFLLDVLDRARGARKPRVDNAFVDRLAAQGEIAVERDADVALLVAAIDAYETERAVDQARFFAVGPARSSPDRAERRPRGRAPLPRPAATGCTSTAARPGHVRHRARRHDGNDRPRAARTLRATVAPRCTLGAGRCRPCTASAHLVEVDGTPHRFRRDDQGIVRRPDAWHRGRRPCRRRRRRGRWRPRRRHREHEDGDGRAGAVRRAGPAACSPARTSRSTPAPPWCNWTRADPEPRRRAAGGPPDRAGDRPRPGR